MNDVQSLSLDFLTDLAQDTHGCWEVFGFVRAHFPTADDNEVFRIGRSLIASWISDGSIVLAATPLEPTAITSLTGVLQRLDALGIAATRYFTGAPSFDLSERGRALLGLAAQPHPPS